MQPNSGKWNRRRSCTNYRTHVVLAPNTLEKSANKGKLNKERKKVQHLHRGVSWFLLKDRGWAAAIFAMRKMFYSISCLIQRLFPPDGYEKYWKMSAVGWEAKLPAAFLRAWCKWCLFEGTLREAPTSLRCSSASSCNGAHHHHHHLIYIHLNVTRG